MVPSCSIIRQRKTNKAPQTQLKSENELAEKELKNESKRLKRTRIKGKKRESSNEKHRQENNAKIEETRY